MGKSKKSTETIPYVDGTEPLTLVIMADDVKGAKKNDLQHCVIAKACRRQFGAQEVRIAKSVACVLMPDENGNPRYERYTLSASTREKVRRFDNGEGWTPGHVLRLVPPTESKRLENIRTRNDQYSARVKNGTVKNRKRVPAPRKIVAKGQTRSGTGAIAGLVRSKTRAKSIRKR